MSSVKTLYNQKPKDRNFPLSRALNHPHEVQRSPQAEDPAEARTVQKPFQVDKKSFDFYKKNSSSVYQEIEFLNSY